MREPGSIVDGKYEVVESLGRGGMGEVYLARHLHLEELRVIKILRQDLAADETAQRRFLREARLATQIKHPNVAILYDFARLPEGSFYMVWEYIEGRHVGQWLEERGPLPVLASIELGIQALRGLEAIHASGVVHRDISPDNLMITRDRRNRYLVKIIDLGLAKNLFAEPNFEVTQAGMFMGKLKYCSPEQAEASEGSPVDLCSDLYSFGLVLYEMITGRTPFEAENIHASVTKRLSEPPLPLVGRNPEVEVPPALDAVVQRVLERDPARRFADAVSLIEALEPIVYELRGGGRKESREPPQSRSGAHAPAPSEMPAAPRKAPSGTDDTTQLSKAERQELLAKIDRAARKKLETTQVLHRAEVLIQAGELEKARRLVEKVEAAAPRARGLEQVRRLLAQRERESQSRNRIEEMERMIASYIQKGQLPLAELALETLLEAAPIHPKGDEYKQWIEILRQELEQDRQTGAALEVGREALARGDVKSARKKLQEIRQQDRTGELAPAFEAEIEAAERQERRSADAEEHRSRFDALLREGQLKAAEDELRRLAGLDLSRVTLALHRQRLEEARAQVEMRKQMEDLEVRYRKCLAVSDWSGARGLAAEVASVAPRSPRSAEMFTEIGRREEIERRRQAVEQGEQQIEAMIRDRRADQAELALQVLLRLDPAFRRRKQLEKQIQALKEAAG